MKRVKGEESNEKEFFFNELANNDIQIARAFFPQGQSTLSV